MATAFLGLGSNLGDRGDYLARALALVEENGVRVVAISPIYETEPEEYTEQPRFLNAACQVETSLAPRDLLRLLKRIEKQLGRADPVQNGPRTIDLDLLLYDDAVLKGAEVEVPHPRMARRAFVLVPLVDIAPGARHPLLGKTVGEMARALDRSGVQMWGGIEEGRARGRGSGKP
ncbi:MAG: 2-amino-4-hydroxy-6-hydroxymethyldihydropteridine diphosphokinase [Dehalococcoidia bacterium]|nr:2-amino-4-hydroxy-6-hydroxymethyldihydropteridine diphosphokinase [Dehalococcoidia bacterium]